MFFELLPLMEQNCVYTVGHTEMSQDMTEC